MGSHSITGHPAEVTFPPLPAEPVSAHPSPAGRPTSQGGPGVKGPAGSPLVGVSALRYPSGLASPPEYSEYSSGQV